MYGAGAVTTSGAPRAFVPPYVPPHVAQLDVYQPGKPIEELERELGIKGAIKVASNENPLGPAPSARPAIEAALAQLHLYPDAGGVVLRRALAARLGCQDGQLALGNGSNDLLYQLVLATCEPTDEVLSHRCAFLSYRLAAQVAGRAFVAAPTTADLACDVDALIAAITPRTKLVILDTLVRPHAKSQYVARSLAGVVIATIVVLVWAYKSQLGARIQAFVVLRRPEAGNRLLTFGCLMVLAVLPSNAILTFEWRDYLEAVRTTVEAEAAATFAAGSESYRGELKVLGTWPTVAAAATVSPALDAAIAQSFTARDGLRATWAYRALVARNLVLRFVQPELQTQAEEA